MSWPLDEFETGPARGPRLWLIALVAVPAAVAAAAIVHWQRRPPAPAPTSAWADDARREVQGIVDGRYVEPITEDRAERLFDAAMKGYVEELDPFSRYYTAKERVALDEDMSGSFGGIGVRVDPVPAGMLVVAVRRGGPAEAAGVVPGDVIEKVGDVPLTGRERDAMIELIKGPEGTRVALTLAATAASPARRVEATRARVDLDTVPAARIEGASPVVGYVRVSQFSDSTGAEAREAVASLVGKGAAAIVLDLRRNLGGVVQAAVDVASLFLPPETLVCTARGRDGAREYRTAEKDGFVPLDLPLVVLVDEGSASASEILAGALQDHGRATLVGDRTYGKFVMQTIVPLAHRGAMLRLTTARYETPRGRSDQRDPRREIDGGLPPDVRVPLRSQDEADALRLEFARQSGLAWNVLPGRDPPHAPDRQLAVALDLLRGGAAPAEPVPPRTN
jgi:carboxyl-terminal processing protease